MDINKKKPYIRQWGGQMSLLSSYIRRQVKKKGLKHVMLGLISMIAKVTPSKKDDKAVQEIKKILDKLD